MHRRTPCFVIGCKLNSIALHIGLKLNKKAMREFRVCKEENGDLGVVFTLLSSGQANRLSGWMFRLILSVFGCSYCIYSNGGEDK